MGHDGGGRFPTTQFSAVRGASSGEAEVRRRSLEILVAAYWRPVYKRIRLRFNRRPEDAEDLTQAFFTRAMEKDFFAGFDPARGRFRTFLRTCLDRFVGNEEKTATRLKRGGAVDMLPLDFGAAESEIGLPAAAARAPSPEEAFDADWVRSLFTLAVETLRRECETSGKAGHFRLFASYDLGQAGDSRPTYEQLAEETGLSASLVTNHLAWTRREFRRLLLESLRSLTASDEEFRLEARHLLGFDPGREPSRDDG